jgi:alditol oxidase
MPVDSPLTNWAGNITFQARRVYRPSSVDELRRLVARSDRLRALGTGHSFSPLADTTGDLVAVAGLPPTVEIDTGRAQVRVAAGVRYGDLVARMQKSGLALHNLASLPHISVGGACATATHGSGDRSGNLSTAVSAIELVTADGDLVTVDRTASDFAGMVVALGSLGVVTALTLDLVPAFDLRQYVYENLPLARVATHLDEIFGNGYSVSLFTDWRDPLMNQVWIKRYAEVPDGSWLGATPADGPRHPVVGMAVENCTQQMGVPGPWNSRLPHFRQEFTPSTGEELQSEYLLDRKEAVAALHALHTIRRQIAPALQISEVRTIAADELWLSTAYRRDSVAIHFTWVKDASAVADAMAAVEAQLAPYRPRPHWGKLFGIGPEVLSGQYPRLTDFQRLLRKYDPTGKFGNELVDRYLRNA